MDRIRNTPIYGSTFLHETSREALQGIDFTVSNATTTQVEEEPDESEEILTACEEALIRYFDSFTRPLANESPVLVAPALADLCKSVIYYKKVFD